MADAGPSGAAAEQAGAVKDKAKPKEGSLPGTAMAKAKPKAGGSPGRGRGDESIACRDYPCEAFAVDIITGFGVARDRSGPNHARTRVESPMK